MRTLIALCLMWVATAAHAADAGLKVEQAWIREAPPGMQMLAGYARLTNAGELDMRITEARSDAFDTIEIHRTVEEDGVSRMRPAGTLEIASGKSVELAPGGLHLMLMHPRKELKDGATVVIDFLGPDGMPMPAVFTVRKEAP